MIEGKMTLRQLTAVVDEARSIKDSSDNKVLSFAVVSKFTKPDGGGENIYIDVELDK